MIVSSSSVSWGTCSNSGQVLLTRWVHKATDNESTSGAASKMQGRAFFHPSVTNQSSLCEEVCRQLHRATETSPDHSSPNTSVEA